MNHKDIFLRAPVERLIRKAGVERVANDAIYTLADILEDQGIRLVKSGLQYANHDGRKTLHAEDIKLAVKYPLS